MLPDNFLRDLFLSNEYSHQRKEAVAPNAMLLMFEESLKNSNPSPDGNRLPRNG